MATFVRVYETEGQAAAAVRDLQGAGFGGLLYVTPDTLDAAGAASAVGMAAYADFAAEQVDLGRSVVGVTPPFGQGKAALAALDGAGPLAVETPKAPGEAAAGTELISDPTPLSSWLGWRVLSDDPTPLSTMFGWKVKSDKTYFTVSALKDDPSPLSSALGWRTKTDQRHFTVSELSNDPTPLSSRLGLQVLSDKQ